MKIFKTIFYNLLFFLIFLGVVFGVGEVYLRVNSFYSTDSVSAVGVPIFQASELQGYEQVAGAYVKNGYGNPAPEIFINEMGLRDDGYKSENNKRNILFLGDSFTFGTGLPLENIFPEIMGKNLGDDFQIINGGVIGYTVDNYYLQLKRLFEKTDPEIIVVNIFVANDVTELRRHEWVMNDDDLERLIDKEVLVDEKGKLRSITKTEPASYFFEFLRERLEILLAKMGKVENKPTLTWPVFLSEDHVGYDQRLPMFWGKFFTSIDWIKSYAEEKNVPVVFVMIPMDVQVSKTYWNKYPQVPSLFDEEAYSADRPQKRIMEYCSENNLTCLDLLPIFRENKNRDEIYFRNTDPHFDLYGHELTAELILEKIKPLINE